MKMVLNKNAKIFTTSYQDHHKAIEGSVQWNKETAALG